MEKSAIENKQFVIDLPIRSTFKEKSQLKETIIKKKGIISYIVNKNVNYIIREDNDETITYKLQRALHLKIPVVTVQFLENCLEANKLLDPKKYYPEVLKAKVKNNLNDGKIQLPQEEIDKKQNRTATFRFHNFKVFKYKGEDGPPFHCNEHAVAKVILLKGKKKKDKIPFCLLEIHVSKTDNDDGIPKYCVFAHKGTSTSTGNENESKLCRYFDDINDTLMAYNHLYRTYTSPPYTMLHSKDPIQNEIGSDLFLPDEWLHGALAIHPKVKMLINHIGNEANLGVQEYLAVDLKTLSYEQIETAKMLLWKILNDFQEGVEHTQELWKEFYKNLPHKDEKELNSIRKIKQKFIHCQILADLLSASESIETNQDHDLMLYRALHCSIEPLECGNEDYKHIISQFGINENIIIDNIYKLHHYEDFLEYDNSKGNERLLLHPTKVQDLIGLLPRGLSLFDECYIRVEDNLTHRTTDSTEIYFLDKLEACLKYTPQSKSCGTRMILINQVALGECKTVALLDDIQPSEDCDSYHCLRKEMNIFSQFHDDEFVIINNSHQKLKFLLEFHLNDDDVKSMDALNLSELNITTRKNIPSAMKNCDKNFIEKHIALDIDISSLIGQQKTIKNLKATLKEKYSNSELPLKSVHVRATLIDLAAEVTVIQEFTNTGFRTIEGKYVFPLSEKAVVCGFEAFTEGRHFVGRIQDKAEAVKEYREAVQSGQRAYLMEEEAPDVFSVNIGNISSGATVIVKITYVSELYLEGNLIKFSIPASISPLESQEFLTEQQSSIVSANISNAQNFDSSVEIFLDMPFPIQQITSTTHKLRIKKTETKAVVKMDKNDKLTNGFHLLIGLSEIHTPRMWIEESVQDTSEACMLVFYPEFDIQMADEIEIIIAMDLSNSMKEALTDAQTVALLCLHFLPENCKFNIIKFGTVYEEFFPIPLQKSLDVIQDARQFILNSVPQSGNSNIRHLLYAYNLLPPKPNVIRNIFIISDGHFNCPNELFYSAHKNQHHTRIFTFGIGSCANNHLLSGLAISSGGGFVNIDKKEKSKWGLKVKFQTEKTCEPVLTDVDVEWKTYEYNESQPLQAPNVITTLFNGSRLVVYGLISHCNLAALKAKVKGHELNSIVYASELSKTKGSTLHCLATRALVDDWCYGNLHLNRTKHELLKWQLKPDIVNLSKTFSIVTPLTSFVAVENKDETLSIVTCTIDDILNKTNIDFLPYLCFEDDKSVTVALSSLDKPMKHKIMLRKSHHSMKGSAKSFRENNDLSHPDEPRNLTVKPRPVMKHKISVAHAYAPVSFKQSNNDVNFEASTEWKEIHGPSKSIAFGSVQPISNGYCKPCKKVPVNWTPDFESSPTSMRSPISSERERKGKNDKISNSSPGYQQEQQVPVQETSEILTDQRHDDDDDDCFRLLTEIEKRKEALLHHFEPTTDQQIERLCLRELPDSCLKPKRNKNKSSSKNKTSENKWAFLLQKWREMKTEKGSLSLGCGLPFVSALFKAFPEKWWLYEDVTLHASRWDELLNSHEDVSKKEISKELSCILEHRNELGGIDMKKIPKETEHMLEFFITYLQNLGLSSLPKSIQEATLNLLISLTAILVFCEEVIPDVLPPNLQDPLELEKQAKTIIETLCEEYHEKLQLAFYGLLIYIKWLNHWFPLVYHTLELGNSWEAAITTLLSKYASSLM